MRERHQGHRQSRLTHSRLLPATPPLTDVRRATDVPASGGVAGRSRTLPATPSASAHSAAISIPPRLPLRRSAPTPALVSELRTSAGRSVLCYSAAGGP